MPISYLMVGTNDLARARTFYDAVMPFVGGELDAVFEGMTFSYKFADGSHVWIALPYNREPAAPANGSMPGFSCGDEAAVIAAHAAALANGGTNEGDPGPRPLYGPHLFVAYVRDPDGNKMSFIYERKAAE